LPKKCCTSGAARAGAAAAGAAAAAAAAAALTVMYFYPTRFIMHIGSCELFTEISKLFMLHIVFLINVFICRKLLLTQIYFPSLYFGKAHLKWGRAVV
jgi:hypothetical protein